MRSVIFISDDATDDEINDIVAEQDALRKLGIRDSSRIVDTRRKRNNRDNSYTDDDLDEILGLLDPDPWVLNYRGDITHYQAEYGEYGPQW
jgi:hypothetical protein